MRRQSRVSATTTGLLLLLVLIACPPTTAFLTPHNPKRQKSGQQRPNTAGGGASSESAADLQRLLSDCVTRAERLQQAAPHAQEKVDDLLRTLRTWQRRGQGGMLLLNENDDEDESEQLEDEEEAVAPVLLDEVELEKVQQELRTLEKVAAEQLKQQEFQEQQQAKPSVLLTPRPRLSSDQTTTEVTSPYQTYQQHASVQPPAIPKRRQQQTQSLQQQQQPKRLQQPPAPPRPHMLPDDPLQRTKGVPITRSAHTVAALQPKASKPTLSPKNVGAATIMGSNIGQRKAPPPPPPRPIVPRQNSLMDDDPLRRTKAEPIQRKSAVMAATFVDPLAKVKKVKKKSKKQEIVHPVEQPPDEDDIVASQEDEDEEMILASQQDEDEPEIQQQPVLQEQKKTSATVLRFGLGPPPKHGTYGGPPATSPVPLLRKKPEPRKQEPVAVAPLMPQRKKQQQRPPEKVLFRDPDAPYHEAVAAAPLMPVPAMGKKKKQPETPAPEDVVAVTPIRKKGTSKPQSDVVSTTSKLTDMETPVADYGPVRGVASDQHKETGRMGGEGTLPPSTRSSELTREPVLESVEEEEPVELDEEDVPVDAALEAQDDVIEDCIAMKNEVEENSEPELDADSSSAELDETFGQMSDQVLQEANREGYIHPIIQEPGVVDAESHVDEIVGQVSDQVLREASREGYIEPIIPEAGVVDVSPVDADEKSGQVSDQVLREATREGYIEPITPEVATSIEKSVHDSADLADETTFDAVGEPAMASDDYNDESGVMRNDNKVEAAKREHVATTDLDEASRQVSDQVRQEAAREGYMQPINPLAGSSTSEEPTDDNIPSTGGPVDNTEDGLSASSAFVRLPSDQSSKDKRQVIWESLNAAHVPSLDGFSHTLEERQKQMKQKSDGSFSQMGTVKVAQETKKSTKQAPATSGYAPSDQRSGKIKFSDSVRKESPPKPKEDSSKAESVNSSSTAKVPSKASRNLVSSEEEIAEDTLSQSVEISEPVTISPINKVTDERIGNELRDKPVDVKGEDAVEPSKDVSSLSMADESEKLSSPQPSTEGQTVSVADELPKFQLGNIGRSVASSQSSVRVAESKQGVPSNEDAEPEAADVVDSQTQTGSKKQPAQVSNSEKPKSFGIDIGSKLQTICPEEVNPFDLYFPAYMTPPKDDVSVWKLSMPQYNIIAKSVDESHSEQRAEKRRSKASFGSDLASKFAFAPVSTEVTDALRTIVSKTVQDLPVWHLPTPRTSSNDSQNTDDSTALPFFGVIQGESQEGSHRESEEQRDDISLLTAIKATCPPPLFDVEKAMNNISAEINLEDDEGSNDGDSTTYLSSKSLHSKKRP